MNEKFQESYMSEVTLEKALSEFNEFGYFSEWQMLLSFVDFIRDEQKRKYNFSNPYPIHLHKDVFDIANVQELFTGWCEYRWFTSSKENMLSGIIPTKFFANEIKYEIQELVIYGE